MRKILSFEYGAIQGAYWMYYGVIMSFASVFLLGKGYTNSEIGVILAFANIIAVVLQPLLADLADRSKKVSLLGLTGVTALILLAATAVMMVFPGKSMVLSIVFIFIGALLTALQPLINSAAFYISQTGIDINFGITRSGGSVAYAVLCAILGVVVTSTGITAIPVAGIIVLIILMLSLKSTDSTYKKAMTRLSEERRTSGWNASSDVANGAQNIKQDAELCSAMQEQINLMDFLKRNKVFLVFCVGIVGVFFQNSVFNNYLLQILQEVGGDSGTMGTLFSVMALLELPGLIFFTQLMKKFTCQFMLKVASVAFTIKVFLVYMANSVAFVYVGFLFHAISFPLFLAGAVYLVDAVMDRGEAVKGQAFVTGMITVATILASLIGGAVLDMSGASLLLIISTALCVLGTIIVVVSVDKIKNHKLDEK